MKTLKGKLIIAILILSTHICVGLAAAGSLPEFYGTYVSQGDKLISLKQGNLTFRTGLSIGDIRSGLYGIPKPPDIRLEQAPFEIIHFSQEISPSKVRLSELVYLTSAPANFFDVKGEKTDPRFFRNVYGVSYNQKVLVNLWVIDHNIPLNIAPVAEKHGMYRLVPKQKLQQGIYAVNFGSVGGPTYYIGNLKFYPFALGTAEWLEGMKKAGQKEINQRSSVREPSSPQQIDIFPGCVSTKSRH
jgi:hypothetical protein